jgi:hypothetical protein
MKQVRHHVRTRRLNTVSRDSGGDTVEVRHHGRWIGMPRWLFDTIYQRNDRREQEATKHD